MKTKMKYGIGLITLIFVFVVFLGINNVTLGDNSNGLQSFISGGEARYICSYSGEGVYKTASCSIPTVYTTPGLVEGVGVNGINLEYAPDCSFTGTIKVNPWSSLSPNKVLWSGTAVGKRSGGTCSFFEAAGALDTTGGESIAISGTINFIKEWHDCEVCAEPLAFNNCAYNDQWMRWQQIRTNQYCGGEYTNWKCKTYTEMTACPEKPECNLDWECSLNGRGNYCISGFCHNIFLPSREQLIEAGINITDNNINNTQNLPILYIFIAGIVVTIGLLMLKYNKYIKRLFK